MECINANKAFATQECQVCFTECVNETSGLKKLCALSRRYFLRAGSFTCAEWKDDAHLDRVYPYRHSRQDQPHWEYH
jgi:hypothetical protein